MPRLGRQVASQAVSHVLPTVSAGYLAHIDLEERTVMPAPGHVGQEPIAGFEPERGERSVPGLHDRVPTHGVDDDEKLLQVQAS